MEFRLSDDQQLFDAALRRMLQKEATLAQVLATFDSGGFGERLWTHICEFGAAALIVPQAHGGLGGGCLDAVVVSEALGSVAAPVPNLTTLNLAPLVVREFAGTSDAGLLSRIASGQMRLALICGDLGAQGLSDLVVRDNRISGKIAHVLEVGAATHGLIVLPDGRPYVIGLDDDGVTRKSLRSLDQTRQLTDIDFSNAPGKPLGNTVLTAGDLRRIRDWGRLVVSAETLGAAQHMLDAAVAYAKLRVQFNRPIGSFQAIKHICADMVTLLEPCRPLIWYAAHAYDEKLPDAHVTACHAKAHVAEVAREVANQAIQIHGAIGITEELVPQLLFKRIAANRQILGSPAHCRAEAAAARGLVQV